MTRSGGASIRAVFLSMTVIIGQPRIQTQIGGFDDRDGWMGGLQKLGVGTRNCIASLM
jgi:hypothetical protein